jgi:hypothetical protein
MTNSAPRRLAAAALLALAVACADDTAAPAAAPILEVPSGAVQAAIQQEAQTPDGLTTLVVRVVSNGLSVSSYQGVVRFAPGSLELVETKTPAPRSAETHILNVEGFADGAIRFAALTASEFLDAKSTSGTEAFRFTVRALRPIQDAHIVVTLDVVGTDVGSAVAASRVLASPGVQNAAGQIIR